MKLKHVMETNEWHLHFAKKLLKCLVRIRAEHLMPYTIINKKSKQCSQNETFYQGCSDASKTDTFQNYCFAGNAKILTLFYSLQMPNPNLPI